MGRASFQQGSSSLPSTTGGVFGFGTHTTGAPNCFSTSARADRSAPFRPVPASVLVTTRAVSQVRDMGNLCFVGRCGGIQLRREPLPKRLHVRSLEIKAQHPDFAVLTQCPDKLALGIVEEAQRVIEDLFADRVRTGNLHADPGVASTVI